MLPGVEAQLDQLAIDRMRKIEGCCQAYLNLQAEAEMLKAERDRFAKRAQSASNAAHRLKDYLKGDLERLGETKIIAGLHTVRIQRNSQPSVKFDGDPKTLPEHLQKVTVDIDRKIAVNLHKEGIPLPEGVRVDIGSHLRIS